MSQDRETPCLFYICAGSCKKNRNADHYHYCQKCDKYIPRAKVKHQNIKRKKLENIRNKEEF